MKTEQFAQQQAEMSNKELIDLCHKQVSELARTGGRSHRMTVPPMVTDTDMLFCELLKRFESLTSKSLPVTNEEIDQFANEHFGSSWAERFSDGAKWMRNKMLFNKPSDNWNKAKEGCPEGIMDWNKLSIADYCDYLENKHRFSSTGEAKAICELVQYCRQTEAGQSNTTGNKMTSARIKEIQETTAYPESVSVQQALLQVWNECVQSNTTDGVSDFCKICSKKFPFCGVCEKCEEVCVYKDNIE